MHSIGEQTKAHRSRVRRPGTLGGRSGLGAGPVKGPGLHCQRSQDQDERADRCVSRCVSQGELCHAAIAKSPSSCIALSTAGTLLSDTQAICWSATAALEGETSGRSPEVKVEQTTLTVKPSHRKTAVGATVTGTPGPAQSPNCLQGCVHGHI